MSLSNSISDNKTHVQEIGYQFSGRLISITYFLNSLLIYVFTHSIKVCFMFGYFCSFSLCPVTLSRLCTNSGVTRVGVTRGGN